MAINTMFCGAGIRQETTISMVGAGLDVSYEAIKEAVEFGMEYVCADESIHTGATGLFEAGLLQMVSIWPNYRASYDVLVLTQLLG